MGGTRELGDSHAELAVQSTCSERKGCRDRPGARGGRGPASRPALRPGPALPSEAWLHPRLRETPGASRHNFLPPCSSGECSLPGSSPRLPQRIHEQPGTLDYLAPPDSNCVCARILLDQLLTHSLHKAAVSTQLS